MASFREIKRRVSGVRNIQQITRAMKMVAAARLRRSEESILALRPYASRLDAMSARLLQEASPTDHPLFAEREVNGVCVLAVASDRGLCGAYNSRVVERVLNLLRERENQNHVVCAVGERAIRGLRRAGFEIEHSLTDVFNPVHYDTAQDIRGCLEEMFLSGRADEALVVFTEFFSPMRQEVLVRRLFPCPPRDHWEHMLAEMQRATPEGVYAGRDQLEKAEEAVYIYEPDYDGLCDEMLEHTTDMRIYRALLEAQASEHGARMMAMDNATDNADEMIDELTLLMNRLRQESITSEILDVVGGAQAQE